MATRTNTEPSNHRRSPRPTQGDLLSDTDIDSGDDHSDGDQPHDPFADEHDDDQGYDYDMSNAITQTAPRTEPRQRVSRSQTAAIPANNANERPTGRHRRSLSEDGSSGDIRSARQANVRTKSSNGRGPPKEKHSAHADVIDQLDISGALGVGGGRFHHAGPFDACAPSWNTKPHRAPMAAFDDPSSNVPVLDKRLSPVAQATIAAMAAADSPYAAASFNPRSPMVGNMSGKMAPQRKMTLTEAWGKAEPEPFEEFSAGTIGNRGLTVAGGQNNGGSARSSLDGDYEAFRRREDARREASSAGARRGESLDLPARRGTRLPPPQPINLPGSRPIPSDPSGGDTSPTYASDYAGGTPGTMKPTVKRTKSLMQRIRNMRENPNVPVGSGGGAESGGYYAEGPYSPRGGDAWTPGASPVLEEETTPQGTLLVTAQPQMQQVQTPGRLTQQRRTTSSRPFPGQQQDDAFVVVDDRAARQAAREKALPAPPPIPEDYFQQGPSSPTRKTSMYKKVKGIVKQAGKVGP